MAYSLLIQLSDVDANGTSTRMLRWCPYDDRLKGRSLDRETARRASARVGGLGWAEQAVKFRAVKLATRREVLIHDFGRDVLSCE